MVTSQWVDETLEKERSSRNALLKESDRVFYSMETKRRAKSYTFFN